MVPGTQKIVCKIVIISLSVSLNICFGCSKEPSHRDGPFEHPQHMQWYRLCMCGDRMKMSLLK